MKNNKKTGVKGISTRAGTADGKETGANVIDFERIVWDSDYRTHAKARLRREMVRDGLYPPARAGASEVGLYDRSARKEPGKK